MNISAHNELRSSIFSDNNLSPSVDPFYIGMGIGLSGGVLIAIIIAHYLYHKRRNKQVDSENCSVNPVVDTDVNI
jgi:hypothetical protein